MNIGQKIKELRLKEKMSQEELANCLGVSTQAVSRWETSVTFPDITLIPILAEIFKCTTDVILCCENNIIDQDIDDIIRLADKALEESDYEDYFTPLKIVKECLLKYPNNERLILETLHRITSYANDFDNFDYSEAIILCEKLLKQSKNDFYRTEAKVILIDCYVKSNLKEKALKIVETIPNTLNQKELKMRIYDKESTLYKKESSENILQLTLDLIRSRVFELDNNIYNYDIDELLNRYMGIEKFVQALYIEAYLKEEQILYSLNHVYIMIIKKYIEKENYSDAIVYVNKLVENSIIYDGIVSENILCSHNKKLFNTNKVLEKLKSVEGFNKVLNKLN